MFRASQYVSDAMTFVVRTEGDPLNAVPIVTTELAGLDPQVAMSRVRTMEDVVADSVAAPRFRTRILALFGVVALLLAAVGLYGVVAFSVTQRSAELGLRMALGAHRQDVLKLVLRQGLVPVGLGIGCGLAGLPHSRASCGRCCTRSARSIRSHSPVCLARS